MIVKREGWISDVAVYGQGLSEVFWRANFFFFILVFCSDTCASDLVTDCLSLPVLTLQALSPGDGEQDHEMAAA